jgi:predicted RND superfamily exporter protein
MHPDARRKVRMTLAAALTGGILIVLVQYLLLPALVRRLTESQVGWLRQAFAQHPGWVLAAIVMFVALLGVPVLVAALWAGRWGPGRVKE